MQIRTSTESPEARLARVHACGVFTLADALAAGATRNLVQRRVASGRWERLRRGVYRIAAGPSTWHQQLAAAVLAGGPEAAASHRSAAALWSLPPFEPGALEITAVRRVREPGVIAHRAALKEPDVVTVGGIRITTPPRTIIDLAAVAPAAAVEAALDDALHRRLLTIPWLAWRFDALRRPGRPGVVVLDRLLDERRAVRTESPLEDRVLRLLRRARLPEPECQYEVRDRSGAFVARADFAYPAHRVAIEADGYRWHSSRTRWQRDLRRGNALLALGWRVIHVTAHDVAERPERIVAIVEAALAHR